MKLTKKQSVIFWECKPGQIRRVTSTRHDLISPENTKEYKRLKNEFNAKKIDSFGWAIWKPGPGQNETIEPGTPVNLIL